MAGRVLLNPVLGIDAPFILFFPTVTLCAWYGGFGPGLLATALGALAALFLYIEPAHSLSINDTRDVVQLALFILGGSFISSICGSLRAANERARELIRSRGEALAGEQAAREEAEKTQQRVNTILESMTDGFVVMDSEWRYTYLNPRAEQLIARGSGKLIGKNFWEVFPDARGTQFDVQTRKAIAEQVTVDYEEFLPSANKWLAVRVYPSKDGGFAAYLQDVTERRQAEKERAHLAAQVDGQRKYLQSMVSSVPGVVWEAWGEPDIANQRIDFVSDYVETMLGYSVEEWLSTPNFWRTIVHPEDQERAGREAAEIYAGCKGGASRFRWLAKDGRVVWVESQSAVICDTEGHPVGMRGVTLDISERKQKEANEQFLAEASTTLASSLDYETTLATVARLAVPHFADWCSVDMANEDGTVSRLAVAHVDPEKVAWAHELQKRYPPDRADPHGVYNVLRTGHPEFYPDLPDELLARSARDEDHLEVIRQIGFRSAMLVPLKARDHILGVLTFVNTESRRHHTLEDLALAEDLASRAALAVDNARLFRAEQQTRQAAERSSDLLMRLQSVSAALSQALTPHQVAVAVTEQGMLSLGAHAGTVVVLSGNGQELEIVGTVGFPQEVVEKWQRFPLNQQLPITDAVRTQAPVYVESFETWTDRYPGLGPLASVTGSRALVAFPLIVEGRTIGAMGLSFPQAQKFNEDDRAFLLALAQQCAQALERARLYETEKRLRTEAEAANRIKDEFLATVSHELRTPLTAIVGWSSMLRTNTFDEAATARALETIERNAKAQAQIIEDLLDVSRVITGKLRLEARPLDLDTIIETATDSVRPAAAAKGISIRSSLAPESITVWGDPSRLQQMIWNLLSNAVKFTPRNGSVEVSLRRVESHVEIGVSDTGQGISPEFLPFVFERFRQADGTTTRAHGGLGLGLAIVRHLVELHGGTVRAQSHGAGRGATFTVDLPLMAAATSGRETGQPSFGGVVDSSPDALPAMDGLRVLLVDDEADARELLSTIVGSCGAEVLAVSSAAEALQSLKQFRPDILVSDIGMPGEDGYTLIRRVRALGAEGQGMIPAIALTAYAREEDRVQAMRAGYNLHLSKPANPAELIAAVGSLAGLAGRSSQPSGVDRPQL